MGVTKPLNLMKEENGVEIRGVTGFLKKLLLSFIFILLIPGTILSFKAFTAAAIGPDAGYYLSVATRISEGWIPFKDLFVEYPPLGMYFYAIPAALSSGFHIEGYFLVNFLFILGTAVAVFLIGSILTSERLLALLGAVSTFALLLYCQGYLTLLEPFTVFFYTTAILLVIQGIRSHSNILLFIAGGLLFLSFFSKQYGLLVLPAIFVYVLMSSKSAGRKVSVNLILFAGFCVFAGVILAYFAMQGVAISGLLKALSGSGSGSGSYGARSIGAMMKGVFSYIVRAEAFLLILPVLLLIERQLREDKNLIFLILLNLCGFLPLYFINLTHYYQLIVPFSVLLGIYLVSLALHQTTSDKINYLIIGSVLLSALLTTAILYKVAFRFDQTNYKRSREEQIVLANELMQVVPSGSQVLLAGGEEMYALVNYLPVEPKKFGYMFHGWFKPEEAVDLIKPGQFLVVEEEVQSIYQPHVNKLQEVARLKGLNVYKR